MRLDHVSYVASHDQISDVVNRIGSQIGTAFIDGGMHPKFGTRNFTAPLLNRQYIEVVCPMDHPATDATPFGRAVKKKAEEGGGWMTWVLATDDISEIEEEIGRKAVEGQRKKPNGSILQWKQLGVLNILEDSQQPFYIQWISKEHPSDDGVAHAKLSELIIVGEEVLSLKSLKKFKNEVLHDTNFKFIKPENESMGIKKICFEFNGQEILID
jgi:Glyoxalase-like domain